MRRFRLPPEMRWPLASDPRSAAKDRRQRRRPRPRGRELTIDEERQVLREVESIYANQEPVT